MSYTPVELRHVRVSRSLFGYNRAMVEQVIEEVAESFEATWRERGELADQVESLEKQLGELKRREELLTHTLVAAEQAASDVRDRAKREAEGIVTEAQNEGREIIRSAQAERERLLVESHRIEAMLRGALNMLEENTSRPEPAAIPVEPAARSIVLPEPVGVERDPEVAPWPREDTREFEPISLPPVQEELMDEPEPLANPQPLLRRLAGGDSRDFDWGE
jgi:chromosome segregation ATPase